MSSLGLHPKTDDYVGVNFILMWSSFFFLFLINVILCKTFRGKKQDKASDSAKELFLPPELIAEILSWLPVKSIQRLKCVCKTWLSIAEDREFIDKQMVRVPSYWAVEEGNGHLIRNIRRGLILEKTDPNSNYRLRNPSTKRAIDLPHHDERDAYLATLYDISSTKSFKVVFPFANDRLNGKGSFKIITVGVDDEWRTVDFPFECSLNLMGLRHQCCGFANLVEGVFIVAILPRNESEWHEPNIVTLEVESEKVWRMSLPQRAGLSSNWSRMGLMDWAGKPSVYQTSDNELLRVWVVEDCKKQKWAEEMIAVDLKPVKDLIADYTPYSFYGNKICMYCSGTKLLSFDIVSKVVTHVKSPKTPVETTWQARASLMEFKGMKPLA